MTDGMRTQVGTGGAVPAGIAPGTDSCRETQPEHPHASLTPPTSCPSARDTLSTSDIVTVGAGAESVADVSIVTATRQLAP